MRTAASRDPGLLLLLLAGLGLAACSEDGTGPTPAGDPADVNAFVSGLPSWSEFSPPQVSNNEPTGSSEVVEETVMEPDVNGDLQEVVYQCTETPWSLTDTPREIVMYEPNASVMWVGNLIQGRSYAGGQGSFQELSIRQRDTLRISIDLLTGESAAVVPNPSLTTVGPAIGSLIQRAHDAGHKAGSSIDYDEKVSYSVEQASLELGLSARYLGGRAKTELNVQRSANERTMVAHFVQKMFTISIELPQRASDFFSDELTQAIWDEQVAAGNVGPDNLPVYIAQITYGRTLTYSLTSTHSEDRMEAAISASFNGLAGGASGYTEAELRETLDQQNIRVTAIGGEGQNVLDLISSGNLKAYFAEDAALTTARPISYQLNNLGDNSPAKVAETTEYTLRECQARPAAGERFDFRPVQSGGAPVPVPYRVLSGNFDDDPYGDLVWTHLNSGSNEVAVGFGRADGSFDVRGAWTHPASPEEGWGNGYRAYVGDFDGDGLDDLVFNRGEDATFNITYVAFSNGDGTFEAGPRIQRPGQNWFGWKMLVGDLNGDGRDDLAWNLLRNTENAVWISLSLGRDGFDHGGRLAWSGTGWHRYAVRIGDVNGDSRDDLVWNTVVNHNRTWVGESNGDQKTLTMRGPNDHPTRGFESYTTLTGDIDRDGRQDLIWVDLSVDRDPTPIHRSLGRANGSVSPVLPHDSLFRPEGAGELRGWIGDFNGDGGADILLNELKVGKNGIWVGFGNVEANFDFSPTPQTHPAGSQNEDWTVFNGGVVILDVNGDGRDDVVWNERSASNRIYVALARPSGS